MGEQEPNMRKALVYAHEQMARQLQQSIAGELEEAIRSRGREQRESQLLLKALTNKGSRASNVTGFTVGNLESFPGVARYYRNLEVGTSVFVGRTLTGMFQNGAGQLVRPIRAGENADGSLDRTEQIDPRFIVFHKEAKQHRKDYKPHPLVVKHPIEGYEFFKKGTAHFRASGGRLEIGFYKEAFARYGVDFMTRWLSRVPSELPSASAVSMRTT